MFNRPLFLMAFLCLVLHSCKNLPKIPKLNFGQINFGKKEQASGSETEKDRSKRESAETAFLAECQKLGAQGNTVAGKDGWLFSGAELKRLAATPEVGSVNFTSAVTAIADYRRQLKQNGVELVVGVVPPKSLIYADKISKDLKLPMKKGVPVSLDSYYVAASEALSKKGVKVVNLTDAFLSQRSSKSGAPFTKGSNEYTPAGARLIAEKIARQVPGSKGSAGLVAREISIDGGNDLGGKAEKLAVRQIFQANGSSAAKVGGLGNSILVIADSTVETWRENQASVLEQLSYETQRGVGVLTGSSCRNEQRTKIMRLGTSGKYPLSNTKVVVWICNALELGSGDWNVIPLKLEFRVGDPTIRVE